MSGLRDVAPDPLGSSPDPLAALRASDRRPRSEVWRERWMGRLMALGSAVRRPVVIVVVVVLAVGIGWRLFAESQPPVEASIPFATGGPPASPIPENDADVGVSIAPVDAGVALEEAVVDETVHVVVHVAGAVARPGIISGTGEWRIDDAVRAAGGAVPTADLDRVNLAARILDGQRIFVPYVDEEVPSVIEAETTATPGQNPDTPINVNTASLEDLQMLPGVGPATAAAIADHRERFGSFATVDSLVSVPGIGPATLEALRDRIHV